MEMVSQEIYVLKGEKANDKYGQKGKHEGGCSVLFLALQQKEIEELKNLVKEVLESK